MNLSVVTKNRKRDMMNILKIYEPAMCCTTGVCGPSVDPELLRVTLMINQIKANGGRVERYNLTDNPMVFVTETKINELLNTEDIKILPITTLNDEVVKTGAYLSDVEMKTLLNIEIKKAAFVMSTPDCGGKDGCC